MNETPDYPAISRVALKALVLSVTGRDAGVLQHGQPRRGVA